MHASTPSKSFSARQKGPWHIALCKFVCMLVLRQPCLCEVSIGNAFACIHTVNHAYSSFHLGLPGVTGMHLLTVRDAAAMQAMPDLCRGHSLAQHCSLHYCQGQCPSGRATCTADHTWGSSIHKFAPAKKTPRPSSRQDAHVH